MHGEVIGVVAVISFEGAAQIQATIPAHGEPIVDRISA